ncbi:hypothetical protein B0O99DRAFT_585342 [Bisporella sp. PMI_857]|nr:hypothetical protein B0O99DRAFT_585342 [Bisporella sp. PMI_857]
MIWIQLLLLVTSLVRPCIAQASGWIEHQVNSTMCYWTTPRAAVIRDTVYLDGGYLWWQPGLADGSIGSLIGDGNPLGLVYTLNFSTPFKTSDNISAILGKISKAAGGGNANNLGPNYVDGGMFANDYEWFTYGGLVAFTDAFKAQDADQVASYQAYPNGLPVQQFSPGYLLKELTVPITRYVTAGAAASAPSENLGFYFGGLRAANFGPIYQNSGRNYSVNADVNSLTLIEANMTSQNQETWTNSTLPKEAPGRASAELVWVPVSDKGILVAIGGVIFPYYANVNQTNNASINALSTVESPKFLSTVSVYDISTNIWYEQETTDPPDKALAQGCTVVASAEDGSSHNIYWYGGFDGIHPTEDFSDEVWVLSIPSFKWVRVSTGTTAHARAGHRCVKPYPDQMFVIGGYASLTGGLPKCVDQNIIQIFNLNTLQWTTSYDPTVYSNYTVPSIVASAIGTQTSPTGGFTNSSLTAVLGTKYDTVKIKNYFPYPKANITNTTNPALPQPTVKSSSGTPSYLAPVLAVVLGLFVITLLILAYILYKKRRLYLQSVRNGEQSESGTADSQHRIMAWLRYTPNPNQHHSAKAATVTTDQTDETYTTSPYDYEPSNSNMVEIGGGQVYELPGMIPPAEMSIPDSTNTGLVMMSNIPKRTASQQSGVSEESHSQTLGRPGISPLPTPRVDSPSLGDQRITSGVSEISGIDRGHLRGISETSVSTEGNYATPAAEGLGIRGPSPASPREEDLSGSGVAARPGVVSPLTPPDGIGEGQDYLTSGAAAQANPKRKSNFAERLEE